jgi:hypothetical protein
MTPSACRWKYQAKYSAMVTLALALVCWGGALTLRGQNANAARGDAQAAAQGQQPAIKSDVRIVLVDVVVTGAKGQTTGGLK